MKILTLALIIALIGIFSIYSCTYQKAVKPWKQQIIWLALGLCIFIFMSNFNYQHLWDGANFLYVLSLALLLVVFIIGTVRLGAQRWLRFAWFNFQPSELVKLIMVIFLAKYFSKKSTNDLSWPCATLGLFGSLVLPLIFVLIPVGLIIEQPDLGSAVMVLFIFIAILYLAGVRLKHLITFLLIVTCSLPLFWKMLRSYQKERLLVFLNPNIDPLGAGYTLLQSKIAIGSGGLFGKGWLSGTQSQLHFLPESHTDFIFATLAEEWGLLGCSLLFLLYYLLIREGFSIAQRTNDYFGKLLAWGISLMLGIQIFINIAMTIGLMPVVGLPLPLMSYGGSSMAVNFIALGILVSIDRRRPVF